MMNDEETNSWIFLAIGMGSSESPSTIKEISQVADGINHAIPTQKELKCAFSWLVDQNLISKGEKSYRLTDEGRKLYSSVSAKSSKIFGMWKYLEKHFETLDKG